MMRVSNRERILLGLAAVVVLVAFLSRPSGTSHRAGKLLSLDDARTKRSQSVKSLAQIQTDTDQLGPLVNLASYSVSPDELQPRMVQRLQELADDSQVHLREIKPLKAKKLAGANLMAVPIEIRFRAPFQPAAIKFLYLVEQPDTQFVVSKLNVTSAEARFRIVDVTAQVTAYTRAVTADSGPAQGGSTDGTAQSTG